MPLDQNEVNKFIEEAKKTNPNAFLKKPFDREQLKISTELAMHSFLENTEKISKQLNHSPLRNFSVVLIKAIQI